MSAISGNWKPNYGDIPAMTIDQLFEKYWQDYAQFRCKTGSKMRANFNRYFAEIKDRLVTDLPPYAVQAPDQAGGAR